MSTRMITQFYKVPRYFAGPTISNLDPREVRNINTTLEKGPETPYRSHPKFKNNFMLDLMTNSNIGTKARFNSKKVKYEGEGMRDDKDFQLDVRRKEVKIRARQLATKYNRIKLQEGPIVIRGEKEPYEVVNGTRFRKSFKPHPRELKPRQIFTKYKSDYEKITTTEKIKHIMANEEKFQDKGEIRVNNAKETKKRGETRNNMERNVVVPNGKESYINTSDNNPAKIIQQMRPFDDMAIIADNNPYVAPNMANLQKPKQGNQNVGEIMPVGLRGDTITMRPIKSGVIFGPQQPTTKTQLIGKLMGLKETNRDITRATEVSRKDYLSEVPKEKFTRMDSERQVVSYDINNVERVRVSDTSYQRQLPVLRQEKPITMTKPVSQSRVIRRNDGVETFKVRDFFKDIQRPSSNTFVKMSHKKV